MRCPKCGAAMNLHAEKLKTSDPEHSADADPILGGVVLAIHCCPNCGKVEAMAEPPRS